MLKTKKVELYWNNLVIEQAKDGQKISSDVADLLFKIAKEIGDNSANIIDLGTGNGILSFMLEQMLPNLKIDAIDIQLELIVLANSNKNKIESNVNFYQSDIREISSTFPSQTYDFIVSNPPHLPLAKYRVSPVEMKAISRNETKCNLQNILDATSHLLKNRGKAFLIYPIERDNDISSKLKSIDLKLIDKIFSKSIKNENRLNKELVCYILKKG